MEVEDKKFEDYKIPDGEWGEILTQENTLIEMYKSNKKAFSIGKPGRTTVEDVIKLCFETGWRAGWKAKSDSIKYGY